MKPRSASCAPLGDLEILSGASGETVSRPHVAAVEVRVGVTDPFNEVQLIKIDAIDEGTAAAGRILHHGYTGALPVSCNVRGLRVRCGNIQVGDDRIFEELYPESRFNAWSVGEFHVIDSRIIPNGWCDRLFVSVTPLDSTLNRLQLVRRRKMSNLPNARKHHATMRCAIYARVSTKDKGQDVENQLVQQRRYATAQGWEITEFIDHETAKHADRAQFQSLFAAASRREIDVVLVWALDRFTREGVAETFIHIKKLRDYGAHFESLTEAHFRTNTACRFAVKPRPVFEVHSPYVIVDAQFQFDAVLTTEGQALTVETSTDDGRTWSPAGTLRGPHRGAWHIEPAVLTRSDHGSRTAVSGSYGYLVRVTKDGGTDIAQRCAADSNSTEPADSSGIGSRAATSWSILPGRRSCDATLRLSHPA